MPEDHTDVALGLNNLGTAQGQLREYDAAKESFQKAACDPPQGPATVED